MTLGQQSRGQRDWEAPRLGTCATASSDTTHGDVRIHLRRAISELVVPTTALSGTHWRQKLARLINWFNDALLLFQNFCLLLHCATKHAWGNQFGFPWNGAVCSDSTSFRTLPHSQLVQPVGLRNKNYRYLSFFSISLQTCQDFT